MPRHDAFDLHGDSSAEGNKFKLIKASAVGANHREINVRVCGRIAVAPQMFDPRESAIFLHTANELAHKLGDAHWALAEGSCVDDGFTAIIVYIRVRCIDPV